MKHSFKNICGVITAGGELLVSFTLQPHVKTIDFEKKNYLQTHYVFGGFALSLNTLGQRDH